MLTLRLCNLAMDVIYLLFTQQSLLYAYRSMGCDLRLHVGKSFSHIVDTYGVLVLEFVQQDWYIYFCTRSVLFAQALSKHASAGNSLRHHTNMAVLADDFLQFPAGVCTMLSNKQQAQ